MKYYACITAVTLLAWGCSDETAPQVQESQLGFEEVAQQLGLHAAFEDDSAALSRREKRLAALPAELAQRADAKGAFAVGDIDADGDVDVVALTASGRAQVLTNPLDLGGASSQFVDESERAGLALDTLAFSPILADLAGDDKPDLLVLGFGETSLRIYENRWPEAFVDITEALGLSSPLPSSGVAVADVDNDGDLDLFETVWHESVLADSEVDAVAERGLVWINDARERFVLQNNVLVALEPSAKSDARRALAPSFADIDGDGDVDLLLAGENSVSVWVNSLRVLEDSEAPPPASIGLDAGTTPLADAGVSVTSDAGVVEVLRQPVQPGTLQFVEAALTTAVSGRGMALGDYDLDGDLDWFVSGSFGDAQDSAFLRNTGSVQQWTNEANTNGTRARGFGLSACFEDFNNDGLLDIFQVADAAYVPGVDADGQARVISSAAESRAALYLGQLEPARSFTDAASSLGLGDAQHSRGALCFDYDKDGDVDLFVSSADAPLRVYRNNLNPGVGTGANFLGLRLLFRTGNPSAIGARVQAVTHGVSQMREVRHAAGTFGGGVPLVHFGFAAEEWIDELSVTWPNGETSSLTDVLLSDGLSLRYKGDE
jgi:enediyne biosynthesis protein E4